MVCHALASLIPGVYNEERCLECLIFLSRSEVGKTGVDIKRHLVLQLNRSVEEFAPGLPGHR